MNNYPIYNCIEQSQHELLRLINTYSNLELLVVSSVSQSEGEVINFDEVLELLPPKKIDDIKSRVKALVLDYTILNVFSSVQGAKTELVVCQATEKMAIKVESLLREASHQFFKAEFARAGVANITELKKKSAEITYLQLDALKVYLQIPENLEQRLSVERKLWNNESLSAESLEVIQKYFNHVLRDEEGWAGQFFVDNATKMLSKLTVSEYRAIKKKNNTFKEYKDYTNFQEVVIDKGQQILASLNYFDMAIRFEVKNYFLLKASKTIQVILCRKLRNYFQKKYISQKKTIEWMAKRAKSINNFNLEWKLKTIEENKRRLSAWKRNLEKLESQMTHNNIIGMQNLCEEVKIENRKLRVKVSTLKKRALTNSEWDWIKENEIIHPIKIKSLINHIPESSFETAFFESYDVIWGKLTLHPSQQKHLNVERDIDLDLVKNENSIAYFVNLIGVRDLQALNPQLSIVKESDKASSKVVCALL